LPVNWPLLLTCSVLVAVIVPTVTLVIVSEAAQPDPVTMTFVPTAPDVGLKAAEAAE